MPIAESHNPKPRYVFSLWKGMVRTRPSMRCIAEDIAERYGLSMVELIGNRPHQYVSRPRQEAMAAMHATGKFSTTQIGKFFGRDHSTISHGIKKHRQRATCD